MAPESELAGGKVPESTFPAWRSAGFTKVDACRWLEVVGDVRPRTAAAWRAAGFDPISAAAWLAQEVLEPDELEPWTKAGFDRAGAGVWTNRPAEAGVWSNHGFDRGTAGDWSALGISPENAVGLRGTDFNAGAVKWWLKEGVDVPEVLEWLAAGIEPYALRDVIAWRSAGVDPTTATRWHAAGAFHEDAVRLIDAGITLEQVERWRSHDVYPYDVTRLAEALGIGIEDAAKWLDPDLLRTPAILERDRTSTLEDGALIPPPFSVEEVESWVSHGYSKDEAVAWRSRYQTLEEAEAWRPYGFSSADAFVWHDRPAYDEVTPEIAARWRDAGFSCADAVMWQHAPAYHELTPEVAARWRDAGFNPAQTGRWYAKGVYDPGQAAELRQEAEAERRAASARGHLPPPARPSVARDRPSPSASRPSQGANGRRTYAYWAVGIAGAAFLLAVILITSHYSVGLAHTNMVADCGSPYQEIDHHEVQLNGPTVSNPDAIAPDFSMEAAACHLGAVSRIHEATGIAIGGVVLGLVIWGVGVTKSQS